MRPARAHDPPGLFGQVLLFVGLVVFLALDAIVEPRKMWGFVRERMGIRR